MSINPLGLYIPEGGAVGVGQSILDENLPVLEDPVDIAGVVA